MSARILATKPVGSYYIDTATSGVTTSAWTVVTAAVVKAGSAVEIFNSTGSTLIVSQGTAGNETATGKLLGYTIPPGGSSFLMPMEIKNAAPLTVKAIDSAATSGLIVFNLFG